MALRDLAGLERLGRAGFKPVLLPDAWRRAGTQPAVPAGRTPGRLRLSVSAETAGQTATTPASPSGPSSAPGTAGHGPRGGPMPSTSSAPCRLNTRPGATSCPSPWPTPGPPSCSRASATSTLTSSTSRLRLGVVVVLVLVALPFFNPVGAWSHPARIVDETSRRFPYRPGARAFAVFFLAERARLCVAFFRHSLGSSSALALPVRRGRNDDPIMAVYGIGSGALGVRTRRTARRGTETQRISEKRLPEPDALAHQGRGPAVTPPRSSGSTGSA